MKTIKFLVLFLILPFLSNAQKWQGSIFVGSSNYSGDLVKVRTVEAKNTKFGFGLSAKNNITPKVSVRGNIWFGTVQGDDKIYSDRKSRGFYTKGALTELSITGEWAPMYKTKTRGDEFKRRFSPYIMAGLGAALFNPSTDYNQPNQSDAANVLINKDKASNNKIALAVPIGGGIKFDLTEKIEMALEFGVRLTTSDYLDGVSLSGNPDKTDAYEFAGAIFSFDIFKNKEEETPKDVVDAPDEDGDEEEVVVVVDTDKDGTPDSEDDCPEVPGDKVFNGCPDTDKDGIIDKDDKCPFESGSISDGGCPKIIVDSDKDGVPDNEDQCPNLAGTTATGGCPDSDGDGIANRNDACPNLAGSSATGGCPDSDGDGVIDKDDKCPNSSGSVSNSGCPTISDADRATLELAMRNIKFETANSILKTESYSILNQLVQIMTRYPNYKLKISGHTDSIGGASGNQILSEKRAKACYNYLMQHGVSAGRMSYVGLGETQPIADNSTKEGRKLNRRVEFELFL